MNEALLRFLAGGLAVTLFSGLSEMLRPKSFAGLFGAAPSVALASLALVYSHKGADVAAIEARSMMVGSIALGLFCVVSCHLMLQAKMMAWKATSIAMAVWLAAALGLQQVLQEFLR